MNRHALLTAVLFTLMIGGPCIAISNGTHRVVKPAAQSWPGGLIIDHTCIYLNAIPSEWIDAAQANIRIHYAHTSHGGQVTTGLSRLESANATYSQAQGSGSLPVEADALCMLDGNPPHSYITPDLYWETEGGLDITQNTLDNNPTINVSLWSWCTQVDYYSSEQVQQYLDAMSSLEAANPDVTFVYMTGNAQATGSSGYNRWVNNEMIRDFCRENNKVLFDFADLDAWSGGEHSTYEYDNGTMTLDIPVEHPNFNGNEDAHTTYTSCEQKGRAFWWLVASLAGWNAPDITITTTPTSASSPSETSTSSSIASGTTTTATSTSTTTGTTPTASTTTSPGGYEPNITFILIAMGTIAGLIVICVAANKMSR